MEYTISNHKHYRDFTIIPNAILQHDEMSLFARGLLCYLLSLPDNWEIRISYLSDKLHESERKILSGIKELIELGYCKREARRIDGKMAGQHYCITDIANDFSVPTKNEGTEIYQNSRPAEMPAPREIGGAYKEQTLFEKEDNIIEKEKSESVRERLCLFINSKFADFDKFKAQIEKDPEYIGADIRYYYECVKNWSASKAVKRNDWIATAKNWMLRDFHEGKLKKSREAQEASEADEWADALKKYAEEKKRFGV